MQINTKFNYGDRVYYMRNNVIHTDTIAEMRFIYTYSGYSGEWGSVAYPGKEEYAFEKGKDCGWIYIDKSKLYSTKEELLENLSENV